VVTVSNQEEQETRADRRARYEALLSTIDKNTATDPSDPRRPSVAQAAVLVSMSAHADRDPETVKQTIQAATENGDVLRWRGREGDPRLALVREPDLRELQRVEGARDHPNGELVGRCHQLLAGLGGDDE
jgi:hypothetical protein